MAEADTRTISYGLAIVEAVQESLAADPSVCLVWGALMGLGGSRAPLEALRRDYAARIVDPPCSEGAIAAMAVGAALTGARPIVPVGTASFMLRAWDQVVHEAAVAHYMSNGAARAPVTFYALHGLRGGGSAQHSFSPQGMLWNTPGLEIALPATPEDAKGLMRAAVLSENPTIVLGHAKLIDTQGPVPAGDHVTPFGRAAVRRSGGDVTIVATSLQVSVALEAADRLGADGIAAEVIDLRTLVPLDRATLLGSVAKTGRLVVVDECPLECSVASEIAAIVAEEAFDALKAPIQRVTRASVPAPFSRPLEEAIGPDAARIVAAARRVAGSRA